MANEIRRESRAGGNLTITLASLATGSARQSTIVDNSVTNYPYAMIYLAIKSGTVAPVAGSVYEIYLIREVNGYRDDNAGALDAAITIENSSLLGTIVVTATAGKTFYGIFDTASFGILGNNWGIAVKNTSGQALDATEANFVKSFIYYVDKIQ